MKITHYLLSKTYIKIFLYLNFLFFIQQIQVNAQASQVYPEEENEYEDDPQCSCIGLGKCISLYPETHGRRECIVINASRYFFRELGTIACIDSGFQLHSLVLDDYYYIHFRKKFFYFFRQIERSHLITLSKKYSNRTLTQEDMKLISSDVQDVWDYVQDEFYDLYNQYPNEPYYWAEKGLIALDRGNSIESIQYMKKVVDNEHIQKLLEKVPTNNFQLALSKAYIDTNQFKEALATLNTIIQEDPSNKEAYFERATVYFELGNFDESLRDFIHSEIKSSPIAENSNFLDFSLGLSEGIIKGGAEAAVEYIPSLLSSMYGLGQGLWAFVQDPIRVSCEMVQATQACIEFVKTHTPMESLEKLVPEFQYLIKNWDTFNGKEKGIISGHIIGKYGIDIFAGMAMNKGIRCYQNLKKANNVMTYEAMQLSKVNQQLITITAKERAVIRAKILKEANLKIALDKEGKHLLGHNNYKGELNKSIFEHSNPEILAKKHAGTGIRDSKMKPGVPRYKEIVNFKEFIGYHVNQKTGVKTSTTWGKIHYAKDGIHIVPTFPKE